MRETCLGFFNIEIFYQSCNFGSFWGIFNNIKPLCCTYQNLCITFTNILVFLLNFSTSWKNCVKAQWLKKSLFWHFWLNVTICELRPKRGWNILRYLKSWYMTESTKDTPIWICFFCFWWTNQEPKQLTVKVELLKQTTPKNCIFMLFLWANSHLMTKPYNFDIKCKSNSESYDQHSFFVTKFMGGQTNLLTVGGFFQRERVLWGWLAGPCLRIHDKTRKGWTYNSHRSRSTKSCLCVLL